MNRDFTIKLGIYLVQGSHELDLHNCYDFKDLRYSIQDRTLILKWSRSKREGIPLSLPESVTIEFCAVSEFRFQPRGSDIPFTEDDCLSSFGYWTDEDWSQGSVLICDDPQEPDPKWLTAIEFMSGAIILVQAESTHASTEA